MTDTINEIIEIKNIEAVAWDLDGTLIDSFDMYVKIAEELAAEFGLNMPTRELMLENYHGSLEDTLKMTFGLETDKELDRIMPRFTELQSKHYEEDIDSHFFDDAIELATQANAMGIKQIVVTNRAHEGRAGASPHSIIARSRIKQFIHEIRCRDQVEFPKPDARVMHDWLVTHNIDPTKVLVVGDQHIDAQLALNLSARAVLVTRNGLIPHLETLGNDIEGKVYVVKTLHEVIIGNNL